MNQGTVEHTKLNCHDKFAKLNHVSAAGAMPPNGSLSKNHF
jgi:hypothetical protein